jgi:hypothetical protein
LSQGAVGCYTEKHGIVVMGRRFCMETLKQDAIHAISKLPESATIDDIMYELYVIDKVNKGREAAKRGESVSIEDLKREMQSW